MAAATMYQTTLRRRICVMMRSGEKLFFCSSPLIGSRRKSNWNYGMITVTIIMINLISGMKVIKNGRLRKQKLRLNAYCWHLSRWRNWCVPEDEKKETEKFWT